MTGSPDKNPQDLIKPSEAFFFYMDHPLRVHIFFYLTLFPDISLSKLTQYLAKPKTTVHHHMKELEAKHYVLTREQITRNFIEILYRLPPSITQFLNSENDLEKALVAGELTPVQMAVIFQSFSSFLISTLQRFFLYLQDQPKRISRDFPNLLLNMAIVDEKTYNKILTKIQSFLVDLGRNELKSESYLTPDSYIIFTAALPFGKLFANISATIETSENDGNEP